MLLPPLVKTRLLSFSVPTQQIPRNKRRLCQSGSSFPGSLMGPLICCLLFLPFVETRTGRDAEGSVQMVVQPTMIKSHRLPDTLSSFPPNEQEQKHRKTTLLSRELNFALIRDAKVKISKNPQDKTKICL